MCRGSLFAVLVWRENQVFYVLSSSWATPWSWLLNLGFPVVSWMVEQFSSVKSHSFHLFKHLLRLLRVIFTFKLFQRFPFWNWVNRWFGRGFLLAWWYLRCNSTSMCLYQIVELRVLLNGLFALVKDGLVSFELGFQGSKRAKWFLLL